MSIGGNLLEINIIGKLHVFGVNSQDLESTSWVRNSDIDLSVESSESSKSGIDRVGSISSGHDDNVGSGLQSIHQSKQLRHDSSLNFSVGLVSLGGDGIDLINKDDCGAVFLGLLKRLS
jgi:hypothetical protein